MTYPQKEGEGRTITRSEGFKVFRRVIVRYALRRTKGCIWIIGLGRERKAGGVVYRDRLGRDLFETMGDRSHALSSSESLAGQPIELELEQVATSLSAQRLSHCGPRTVCGQCHP